MIYIKDVKIGIPFLFLFTDNGKFLKFFLEDIGFNVIVSPSTDNNIIDTGGKYVNTLITKDYLGHFLCLKDKCDYIVDIINDYSIYLNDLYIDNIISLKMVNYDFRYIYKAFDKIFIKYDIPKKKVKSSYLFSKIKVSKLHKSDIISNTNKLFVPIKKILICGNPFIIYDSYLMSNIYDYFRNKEFTFIYYDMFDKDKIKDECLLIPRDMYSNYEKNVIGSFNLLKDYIEGVIIISDYHTSDKNVINYLKKKLNNICVIDIDELSTGKVLLDDIFINF